LRGPLFTHRASWFGGPVSHASVVPSPPLLLSLSLPRPSQVELISRWRYNPERATDGKIPLAEDEEADAFPDMPCNELVVVVVRARNLPVMDEASALTQLKFLGRKKNKGGGDGNDEDDPLAGSSDPLVTLTISGTQLDKAKTSIKKKNLNPVWKERFAFPVTQKLFHEVRHRVMMSRMVVSPLPHDESPTRTLRSCASVRDRVMM